MPRVTIGKRLRSLREQAGWSQQELARRSGFSNTHISTVESDRSIPSPRYLGAMAQALGVSLDAILEGLAYSKPRTGPRTLRQFRRGLRRAFPGWRYIRPMCTVRVAYQLATYTKLGHFLLDTLAMQKGHPRRWWTCVKWLAEGLNGPEQAFVLHELTGGGEIEHVGPHEIGFPQPVVTEPRRPWLGIVVPTDAGYIVIFPQVRIPMVDGGWYKLDFLVGVSVPGREPVFFNVEIDGPTHRQRRERDEARERRLGLPTIRLPEGEVARRDCPKRFVRAIKARLGIAEEAKPRSREARKTA